MKQGERLKGRALSVLADPPADAALLQEALFVLDADSAAHLNAILRSLSLRSRKRWLKAITSIGSESPFVAVDILYRLFLLRFPDRPGAMHYASLLSEGRLSPEGIAHIFAMQRPLELLLHAPSAFLFHLWGLLQVKLRARYRTKRAEAKASDIPRPSPPVGIEQAEADPATRENRDRPCIAIVIHRAGSGFSGGAERLALEYARYLGEIGSVEILTTQAKDYLTWKNEFPPGLQIEDGLYLRRFPVAEERHRWFHVLSSLLRRLLALIRPEKRNGLRSFFWRCLRPLSILWMRWQGPYAPELKSFIEKRHYDLYIFITYLYQTTFGSLPSVADRAVVVPTAHPEWPLRLPIWPGIFNDHRPGWIFLTEEEHRFLRQWFPQMKDGPVTGCGLASVNSLQALQRQRSSGQTPFRNRYRISGPFVLYTGRIDPEKGCRTLIAYFLAFLQATKQKVTLVLMGTEAMTVPDHPAIVTTGFVDESMMQAALCECSVYVHPSPYESFSFSLLEAMAAGAPVLVTAESDVLRGHVIRSRAGLFYRNLDDFIDRLSVLLREPQRFESGPAYVQKRYSHEAVKGSLQRFVLERIVQTEPSDQDT